MRAGRRWIGGAVVVLVWAASASSSDVPEPLRPDDVAIVDCLLPGQLRQLGRKATYLSARRPMRTAAYDCARRGGEFVAYDRATFESALATWLPRAEAGDAEAANQVGEIYERGLGVPPDYDTAARWYLQAAEDGNTRAQINLAHLYERGFGVEQSLHDSLLWYRRAAALPDAVLIDSDELARSRDERERLQRERDDARTQWQNANDALQKALKRIETLERGLEEQSALDRERHAEALAAARQEAETLRQQIDAYGQQLEAQGKAETQSPVASAPPEIAVIDPPLGLTRAAEPAERRIAVGEGTTTYTVIGRVTAAAGLATLDVNGVPAETNALDIFESEIAIEGDTSVVEITAVDSSGKRAVRRFALVRRDAETAVASESPSGTPRSADYGGYHALVIGNNDYRDLPNLRTAIADARAVAEVLRSRYGFRVELLEDADRREMLTALNAFRERLGPDDNFVLYYAGHGEIDTVNQRGYWLPVDAEPDNPANWVSNVFVTDTLNVIRAKQAMIIVDACYSGALTRSSISRLDSGMKEEERAHWLRVISRMRARTVLTSGGLKPVSDVAFAGGTHSVFATALLKVLRANEGVLEGQRLFREVAARVAYATEQLTLRQIPEYAPIRHAGHEAGDFLLVPDPL